MGLIHILDVDIKKGLHGFSKTIPVADHDQRIADPDLRRAIDLELAHATENLFNEANQLLGLRSDNPRSHSVPAVWLKAVHRCCLCSFACLSPPRASKKSEVDEPKETECRQ